MKKENKILRTIKTTREFTGSVIPVGSKAGKVLLNSSDFSNIMDAVRDATTGKAVKPVKLSIDTSLELRREESSAFNPLEDI